MALFATAKMFGYQRCLSADGKRQPILNQKKAHEIRKKILFMNKYHETKKTNCICVVCFFICDVKSALRGFFLSSLDEK